jgi:hypothetical protein
MMRQQSLTEAIERSSHDHESITLSPGGGWEILFRE